MSKLSFDQFTKKIYIRAPLNQLYDLWGTPGGITSWFLKAATYTSGQGKERATNEKFAPGDSYAWRWHNWDGMEKGLVLQANGKDFLEFTFEQSMVSITLEKQEKATLLTLRQYDIPTDDESKLNIHHGCSNGWTFWLANLKAYVEHGILLNETEFDLTNIPQAGFEFVNM